MKFIADVHISPRTVQRLRGEGYAIHRVTEFLPSTTKDEEILEFAFENDFVVITQDLDFSALLAKRGTSHPSIITLRSGIVDPEKISDLLWDAIPVLEPHLLLLSEEFLHFGVLGRYTVIITKRSELCRISLNFSSVKYYNTGEDEI